MGTRDKSVTEVPSKNPRVAVYLPNDLLKRLEIEAYKEERSLSQMALILIREALVNRDKTDESSGQDIRGDRHADQP